MTVTINGTTGVVYPDGVTQGSGVPTASATSGAPLVSNGTVYTQTTAVGVAFGGTGATSDSAARTNLGLGTIATQNANNVSITGGSISGLASAVAVASGGTGQTSLTANNVILGNGTSAVQLVAPGTNGNVLTSNGTTWTSTALPAGGVTSAVAGNGIAVSGATGAVTFSAACPGFNTVGSYSYVYMTSANSTTAGSNYSAGTGTNQVQAHSGNFDGSRNYNSSLSGTWKWMSGSVNPADGQVYDIMGLACRVS